VTRDRQRFRSLAAAFLLATRGSRRKALPINSDKTPPVTGFAVGFGVSTCNAAGQCNLRRGSLGALAFKDRT